jgi:uncharacterized membrane protein
MSSRSGARFWELDMLRGLAVVMMVLYHLLFDLSYLGGYDIDVSGGFWLHFAQATASIFIVLAGISMAISRSRAEEMGQSQIPKMIRRSLLIFSLGMVITLVTYILFRDEFIIFGILHFLGISIVLAYPLLKMRFLNLIAGSCITFAGLYMQGLSVPFHWLIWLGLAPDDFYTLDYFPLIPWLGIVLIGVFLGNSLYGGQSCRECIPDLSACQPILFLSALGRNSLLIYLIHQPLLIMALIITGAIGLEKILL